MRQSVDNLCKALKMASSIRIIVFIDGTQETTNVTRYQSQLPEVIMLFPGS